jgi:hypothetical protein
MDPVAVWVIGVTVGYAPNATLNKIIKQNSATGWDYSLQQITVKYYGVYTHW